MHVWSICFTEHVSAVTIVFRPLCLRESINKSLSEIINHSLPFRVDTFLSLLLYKFLIIVFTLVCARARAATDIIINSLRLVFLVDCECLWHFKSISRQELGEVNIVSFVN